MGRSSCGRPRGDPAHDSDARPRRDGELGKPGDRAISEREVERAEGRGEGDDEARGPGPRGTPRGPERGWRHRPGAAFPQGSLAPEARAGSDPESGKRCGKSRPFAGRPSGGWRGVAPSPILRANAGPGGEDEVPEGQRGQGPSRSTGCARNGKRSGKRWVLSFCRKMLTPKAAQRANKAVLGSHKHVRPAWRCP